MVGSTSSLTNRVTPPSFPCIPCSSWAAEARPGPQRCLARPLTWEGLGCHLRLLRSLSPVSSLLTLTAEEAAVWARCPTERRGDLIITCLGKGLFIMSATDPPLTADPRDDGIRQIKIELVQRRQASWAGCEDVSSGSGPLRGHWRT